MSEAAPAAPAPARSDWPLLALLSAFPVALLVVSAFSRGYGYFIDEFYYLACSKRLAFGYVDHPPLAPWLLAGTRTVIGESILAIRFAAYLALGATVWVTGILARRLGGGRFAVIIACLGVGLSPLLLAMSGFFSMNAFEPLLWTLIVLTLVRIVQTGNSRLWLLVGLLTGVAFENKHTVVAYLLPLAIGILLTRTRRVVLDRWLWAGAGIAAALALPNIVWQVANGWPSLEFYGNAHLLKNVPAPPLTSLVAQVLTMNPLAFPVWAAGLLFLLAGRGAERYRFLGIMFVVLLAMHVASKTSRPDRTAAAYPLLFAAGGVAIEQTLHWLARQRPRAALTARFVLPALLVASAAFFAPIVLPLVSPPSLTSYVAALGLNVQAERGKSSPIPQLLADRTGWESYVADVARVYWTLPAADRQLVLFYAPSYGQAGSLELLGPRLGLPDRVIGTQNTYWHWSVGRVNTDVLIAVDANEKTLQSLFAEVWEAGRIRCDYCMSWRNDIPIYVARRSIVPLDTVWPHFRHYE
jgi:4-amino-4-deoxy-L-arabinose transferase-like glycosyltransferase